jgi:RNA polymerase sigma-70 factor (ECF subfamily)
MPDSPDTRPSLLVRIRDAQDRDAWRQFVELYGPVVYRFGRKRGLQDADAADLTQTVLQAVSGAIGRLDYDSARGAFRGWLFAIVRNQLSKMQGRERRAPRGSGGTSAQEMLHEQPAREEGEEALWDREYKHQRFRWAAERARGEFAENSWQAFWQTAVEGRPAADVAGSLGMKLGALYTARSRVLKRIRQEIQELNDEELSSEGEP